MCQTHSNPVTVLEPIIENDARIAPRWHVILHNDDHHSFEFVIDLLVNIFRHNEMEALVITLNIHESGRAIAATVSKERASLYLEQVASYREKRFTLDLGPLDCSMEAAE